MTAWVDSEIIFTPQCAECVWYGDETGDESQAEEEAEQHDRDKHS